MLSADSRSVLVGLKVRGSQLISCLPQLFQVDLGSQRRGNQCQTKWHKARVELVRKVNWALSIEGRRWLVADAVVEVTPNLVPCSLLACADQYQGITSLKFLN